LLVLLDDLESLFLGASNLGLLWSKLVSCCRIEYRAAYLSPAAGSSAVAMLDEKMGSANLALGDTGNCTGTRTSAMVRGHVVLEFLGVGAGGGFPSRQLLGRVEVVGEVLGVGVSDLPARRKTGVSHYVDVDLEVGIRGG
jgi:hypothetical protein